MNKITRGLAIAALAVGIVSFFVSTTSLALSVITYLKKPSKTYNAL